MFNTNINNNNNNNNNNNIPNTYVGPSIYVTGIKTWEVLGGTICYFLLYNSKCTSLLLLVTVEFNAHFLATPRYCRIQCTIPCYSLVTVEFNMHCLVTPPLLYNSMCTSLLLLVSAEFNVHYRVTPRYFRIQCALTCYCRIQCAIPCYCRIQ